MEIDSSALTISSALTSLRAGQFSALELTEACLRQIEHLNPILNAFITPTLELAYQAALQADALHSLQASNLNEFALLGIPLALKDLIETSGVTTTAGSRFFIENIPGQDAEVALRLKLAGAVILGKTNTHEIALGVTGINPHFGAVKNPWDHSRISGGSSSGSAAAVATGMCLGALGTDTGGSIRIPASLCGLVGLKPTYGRVSARGVIPLSWNLDHVGTLTHTVRDAALLLQVLAGYDPHDPVSENVPVDDYLGNLDEGVKTWRVAMAMGEYVEESDPDMLTGLQNASLVFKNMGAHVEKVDLSWIADLAVSNSRITQADAAAYHHQRLIEHPDWFGADVLQRLQAGAALSSSEYALARRMQSESHRSFENFFGKYDLLILPTTPISAPPIEGTAAIEAARQLTRFTSPFNLTGLPALTVPCGFSDGLPFGLQMVSQPWSEARLLQAGSAFEKADPWHENQFRLRVQ